jgi:hypothetical protein
MKVTKKYLRDLVLECINDMSYEQTVSNMANATPNAPFPMQQMGNSMSLPEEEGRMAKGNLFKMAEAATMLHNIIEDNENLEPWVEEKIAVATEMIGSVADYLKYNKVTGKK